MSVRFTSPAPYSEEWWRITLSSIGDAVIVTDAGGKIAFMNPVAQSLTGWKSEDARDRPIEEVFAIVNETSRATVESPVSKVLQTGEFVELANHTILVGRAGAEVPIDDSAAPIRDARGEIFGVVLVFRDVTERRQGEAARRELAAIIESSDDAIIGQTLDGLITSWNKGAERIYGYTAAEVLGQPVSILTLPDRPDEIPMILERLRRGERIEHYETLRRRKDGTLIDVSLTISPIRDGEGQIIGASKIARDITEHKRADAVKWRLSAIVESSDDAIVAKTLEGVITNWNRGAERIFGYTEAEAVGQKIYLLIPPDRHHEEEEILAKLRRGERIEHYETVRRRKDGTLIDVSLTISPIRDAAGQIIGASKIARDITRQKRAARQLEEEREALETINRVSRTLSAELDLEKVVQSLTDAATEITGARFGSFFYNVLDERGASYMLYALSGVPREHFAHFPMPRATDLFGPTFRGEGVVRIDDVKQDPRYGKNSPYFGMPEGHLPVTSYLALPVISRSGEVLGGLFFGHPEPGVFTERHERIVAGLAGQAAIAMDNARLYETTRKAWAEAEEANRLKDEFLATVSHELRNPLNSILGWARMLRIGKFDDEGRRRAVETIEKSAVAQGQIIEDILDVSRIITGKLRLEVSPVEIARVVEDAVETVRPTADARGVRLQAVLGTSQNLVQGDPHRLQQIIWNLLSNAIKFTPKGGRVQVTLARINSHVEIAVSDTGQGISRDFLPHVFERFRQADSSITRKQGGLGLGLAISRHLTELHGGTITAESAGVGQGATFIVRLPLAVIQEGKNRPDSQQLPHFPRAVEGPVPDGLGLELTGVRALVVDDEAEARELLQTVLRQCRAEVRAAGSVREALEMLRDWDPDILISDIGMPMEDGYALIRQVRALSHKEGGSIPAVALTAYARSEDRLRALTAGFQMHVAKPVDPTELAAVVASLTGRIGPPGKKP
ncbi:MAG TPA: PAS domain S-box protein [Blastocatellia bacterium]|nr:PAS domain S-box protein [Blastocatellia bacterium]